MLNGSESLTKSSFKLEFNSKNHLGSFVRVENILNGKVIRHPRLSNFGSIQIPSNCTPQSLWIVKKRESS